MKRSLRNRFLWNYMYLRYHSIGLVLSLVEAKLVNESAMYCVAVYREINTATVMHSLNAVLSGHYKWLSPKRIGDWHFSRLIMLVQGRALELR